jgi:lysophospholipase L1-like esterase
VSVLAREERRWLPWAPVLLAEALYAKLATSRLPPARDPAGCAGSGATTIRLAGLGDSIIAGIGVQTHADGLVGQVAGQAASLAGASVEWRAFGESGATSLVVMEHLLSRAIDFEPQLVVLSVGVNDAITGVRPSDFKQRLRAIVETLAGGARRPTIVFGGLPPLASFPALPWPLSQLLGERAQALQEAAVQLTGFRGLRVVVFPARLQAGAFSRDRFHPGVKGCRDWAGWIVNGMAPRLQELSASGAPTSRQ